MTAARPVHTQRYSRGAILFHWTIAAFVLVNLWIGLVGGSMAAHKAIGITVLVLTLGRIGWRIGHAPPLLPAGIPAWERMVATATHLLFYALLLIVPLSGWAMVSGATRRPLEWFGLFPIPYLPIPPAVADLGHEAHEVVGFAMAGLVALHVAAALRHHFLLRDGVLLRMVPGRRTTR
ncbi:cytochrome b [Sphingomonas sp. 2R-10]|uniref:cytochrome b n=1 Tax=Sphingomonas sp. 2R-10 TaxID=3045148 RepID=UPI000F77A0B3|nr:cytochrome b [Sphingomonas sp. 2R-10]MDJ0276988.1 cytochrome b [Sphingomonas sp. 2R-10]